MDRSGPVPGPRRRRLARASQATALLAAVVLVVGAVLFSRGTIDTWDPVGPWGRVAPPVWAAPCLSGAPRADRQLLSLCARVRGRVLWVQRDDRRNVHFALISRHHLFVVRAQRAPGIGSSVQAVGPLVRAANGQREVEARTVREHEPASW